MPIEATRACLAAIRGWAKLDDALPRATTEPNDEERNWRLVAGLLLGLERNDDLGDQAETWRQLHEDPRNTVLTLSTLEGAASWEAFEGRRTALHDLYGAYSSELRRLFEWALDHLESIPAERVRRSGGPRHYVIRALGQVGDLNTAQRLRLHTLDPEAGIVAVASIRQIHQRHGT